MEKTCYTNKLDELEIIMDNNKPSPFNNFVKILCLTTMNMRYENVAFNSNLEEHPYVLTEKIINETIIMYSNIIEISFIESDNNLIYKTKSKDLVIKHRDLWQEIWSRHNEEEFRNDELAVKDSTLELKKPKPAGFPEIDDTSPPSEVLTLPRD